MKKMLSFILMIMPLIMLAQTPVPPGTVSGTWDLAGSPYLVSGQIYIVNQDTLNIEPGVEVRFTGWYKFLVYGSLFAEGTETDQILFTADDTNNRWHGIRFMYATGTAILDHCIVEYGQTALGGGYPNPDFFGGGVLCYNSDEASITIKNSIIRNNIADIGGGIEIHGTYPLIENCEIVHNTAEWGGGIDAMFMTDGTGIIKNCTIAYNGASKSGGGISAGIECMLHIHGNVIKYNDTRSGGGIRIYQPNELLVSKNTIVHNYAWVNAGGIGLWSTLEIGTFKDNTIAYNRAEHDGGGAFVAMNCSPSFESDIMYFNLSGNSGLNQVHLDGTGGAAFFNYCDVQDGCDGFSGIGAPVFPSSTHFLNCIDSDPLFADPDNDDFSLTWVNYPLDDDSRSECIDNGCAGLSHDPDGTCNDIGALSYFQELFPPDTLYADNISGTGFRAIWSYANPATGYYLDVAEDALFSSWVLENQQVDGDTSYYIEGLDPETSYYFRVRAYNATQLSDHSIIQETTTLATSIVSPDPSITAIYNSGGRIHINYTNENIPGSLWVYNLSGQLLKRGKLNPGSNAIDPGVSNQIVILRVIVDDTMHHKKIFIH